MAGHSRIFSLLFLVALALPAPALAEDGLQYMDSQRIHLELTAGYAIAMKLSNAARERQFFLVAPSIGVFLTDPLGDDPPLRGVPELLVQWDSFTQVKTAAHGGWAGGVAALIRWNFGTGTPFVPFIDGGLGMGYLDFGLPEEGGRFTFQVEGGLGTHIVVDEHFAFTFEYRFHHFSNGGIYKVNWGVNLSCFELGVSFYW